MREKEEQSPPVREDIVIGRNAVLELLKSKNPVESIYIASREQKGSISRIISLAREQRLPIKEVADVKLDYMCGKQNHQGVVAVLAATRYSEMEDIYRKAGDEPLFVVLLDDITDPHNLGAIIRSAEGAGAHGVIIPKRGGAGLTAIVSKTSAGAIEHLPVVRVPNLVAAIEQLKKDGVWVYGADMNGSDFGTLDYNGPVALVVGAEGRGLGRLVKEKCDFIASIPMAGQIGSLNVSVATGVILFEISRQRRR